MTLGCSRKILNSEKKNMLERTEAVVRRYSVKKLFLEISQNSQENNFARDFFKLASSLQLY